MSLNFRSLPNGGHAVILGSSGGIGSAMLEAAKASGQFATVSGFARPELDISDEASIAAVAQKVSQVELPLRLVLVATGYLHGAHGMPEKGLKLKYSERESIFKHENPQKKGTTNEKYFPFHLIFHSLNTEMEKLVE